MWCSKGKRAVCCDGNTLSVGEVKGRGRAGGTEYARGRDEYEEGERDAVV